MNVNLRMLTGNWDVGFALDKHTLSSVYIGDNEFGRPQFDTTRSEVGEALFQLKYRQDWSRVAPLAAALAEQIVPKCADIGLIVPMPASNARPRQPVNEIARELGNLIEVPVFENIIVKAPAAAEAPQLKDIVGKDGKVAALQGRFSIRDSITTQGRWNALLVDDLFDSGASMEAACAALRTYPKIARVYVAALTWK